MRRKLTTIFYADAARYASGMARDETGALDRLQRRKGLMADAFARHGGRQVNAWGDAVIAEFESVVEAIRCAAEVQEAIRAENESLPEPQRMWFRIGVNLGDIIVEEGDVYGDGVNVAARLQALAEPGGVVVSQAAHDLAHRQLSLRFDALEARRVKRGEAPVPGYRLRVAAVPVLDEPDDEEHAVSAALARLRVQPIDVQIALLVIAFFVLVNVIYSDILNPWFIFPSAPFAIYAMLRGRWRGARR